MATAKKKSSARRGANAGTAAYSDARGRHASGPGDDANEFTGPIVPIERMRGTDTFVRLLSDTSAVTVNGSGVTSTSHSSDPTGMTQWANMIGNVDAYRVLALDLEFLPVNIYNNTLSIANASALGTYFEVVDMNSAVALTSGTVACEFASMKAHCGGTPWRRVARAAGRELMTWNDTNTSPTYLFAIKTYSSGNTASITLGQYVIRRLIQFRSTV
jgi:hypothetical protein